MARSSILENRHHPNTLNGRNGQSELQYLVKHFVKWSSPFCLPIHWEKDILVPRVKHWDESYSRNLIHLFLCNLGKHEDKKLRTVGLLPFVWIDTIPFPSLTTTLPYTQRIMGGLMFIILLHFQITNTCLLISNSFSAIINGQILGYVYDLYLCKYIKHS